MEDKGTSQRAPNDRQIGDGRRRRHPHPSQPHCHSDLAAICTHACAAKPLKVFLLVYPLPCASGVCTVQPFAAENKRQEKEGLLVLPAQQYSYLRWPPGVLTPWRLQLQSVLQLRFAAARIVLGAAYTLQHLSDVLATGP